MSNKSRRHAGTSRRRLSMAAGALLAGAAIPIAAGGTAWADQTSDGNNVPPIPIVPSPASFVTPATTPVDITQSASTLVGEGFTSTEAAAIAAAEGLGPSGSAADAPVEASVNGKVVVEVNEVSGSANEATARSSNHGISAAIGGGSESTGSGTGAVAYTDGTSQNGNSDSATAVGSDASASNTGSTGTAVKADGADATASASDDTTYTSPTTHKITDNSVTATDKDASASSTGDSGVKVTATGVGASATSAADIASTVTADGNPYNGAATVAEATDLTGSKVDATGTGAQAVVTDATQGTNVTATADGTQASAYGDNVTGSASTVDSITATGGHSEAYVVTDGTGNQTFIAKAEGLDARAVGNDVNTGEAIATGEKTFADAQSDTGGTNVTAIGTEAQAGVFDSSNSTASSKDDPDPTNTETTGAYVYDSSESHAIAEDPRSQAEVYNSTFGEADATGGRSVIVGQP